MAWQLSVLAVRTHLGLKSALMTMTLAAMMLRFVSGRVWIRSKYPSCSESQATCFGTGTGTYGYISNVDIAARV